MRLPRQFSLRALGLIILFVSVLLAIWVGDSKKQRSAVGAIHHLGGDVTYEPPPSFVPRFIVDGLGHDYFCDVEGVTLYPIASADADKQVVVLESLTELRSLAIWPGAKGLTSAPSDSPGGLTDAGLEFLLTHLRQLEHLSLLSARFTQTGEERLLEQTRISSLQYKLHSAVGGRAGVSAETPHRP